MPNSDTDVKTTITSEEEGYDVLSPDVIHYLDHNTQMPTRQQLADFIAHHPSVAA